MYERRRNIVTRGDGRPVNVARTRGMLFVCHNACCCGRTEDGTPAVPVDVYHDEWERRHLRNVVHLSIGGCLGPCALANVVLLLFEGQALWFQGMNAPELVWQLYDYIEALLDADAIVPPPPALAARQFTGSTWQPRPDGQPVDDHRPRRHPAPMDACAVPYTPVAVDPAPATPERLAGELGGPIAPPRKNGELVFAAPWQGRAFGLAVALNEDGAYAWDDFRERLIGEIAAAEARGEDGAAYYERWLAAFERLLTERGLVTPDELEERTYQFEFGERDEVF
jgi:nitrile hydratase accessory protein